MQINHYFQLKIKILFCNNNMYDTSVDVGILIILFSWRYSQFDLLTDSWSHVHLSEDRGVRPSLQFKSKGWSANRVSQPFLSF